MRGKTLDFWWTLLWMATALRAASAQVEVNCTVTPGDGWMEYSVPKHDATSCDYSWSNSSGHVIANKEEQDAKVLKKSDWSVRFVGCSEQMDYHRVCISEGTPRVSSCNITCRDLLSHEVDSRLVIAAVCAVLLLVLILVLYQRIKWQRPCTTKSSPGAVEAQRQSAEYSSASSSVIFSPVSSENV